MISFKSYFKEAVLPQKQETTTQASGGRGGSLQSPMAGGTNNNWGGALPKLISILPPGNWFAGSQKRSKRNTASGGVSDHYTGNSNAYACDFGLGSAFNNNKGAATQFAINVANNAGQNLSSWQPYVGRHLTFNTNDGYRVQIIWQSMVGGNHYDHVHVGVKAGANAAQNFPNQPNVQGAPGSQTPSTQDGGSQSSAAQDYESVGAAVGGLQSGISKIRGGISNPTSL